MRMRAVATVVVSVFCAAVALVAGEGARAADPSPAGVASHEFIGADRCQSCHVAEYESWQRTPHARAYEALGEKERKDPRCLSCHTLVSDDARAGLLGVQCESCHGPGKNYAVEWVMRDAELREQLALAPVSEKTCLRCHTASSPSLTPFDYATKLKLVTHP